MIYCNRFFDLGYESSLYYVYTHFQNCGCTWPAWCCEWHYDSSNSLIFSSLISLVICHTGYVLQNADNDLWEANRMVRPSIATRKAMDLDFENESESTVHIMVHDLKPPFLDGHTIYTKQLDPINPTWDPTSDMAIFLKKGSALVKEKREQAERAKAAAKLVALGGTLLGNIMGVKDKEAEAKGVPFYYSLILFCQIGHSHSIFLTWVSQLKQRGMHRMQRQKGRRRTIRVIPSLPNIWRVQVEPVLLQRIGHPKSKGSICLLLRIVKNLWKSFKRIRVWV